MAIGFPASYRQKERIAMSQHELRALVVEALGELKWRLLSDDGNTLTARVSLNLSTTGERISIIVSEGELEVISKCRMQIVDWGKNKKNVQTLFGKLPPGLRDGDVSSTSVSGSSVATSATVRPADDKKEHAG